MTQRQPNINLPNSQATPAVKQPSIAAPSQPRHGTTTNRNALPAAQRPLTPRQRAFVNNLVTQPQISATQAYLQAYGNNSVNAARVEASRTLAKPNVYNYLQKFEQAAQDRIAGLVLQTKDNRLAFDASRDLLDRINGKATQRSEATTAVVTINLDLTAPE